MDEINKFAKDNDLARKFEKAIEKIHNTNGWAPFAGLEHGEVTVKVIYDGRISFQKIEKPKPKPKKKAKKKKAKPGDVIKSHTGDKKDTIDLEVKADPEAPKEAWTHELEDSEPKPDEE